MRTEPLAADSVLVPLSALCHHGGDRDHHSTGLGRRPSTPPTPSTTPTATRSTRRPGTRARFGSASQSRTSYDLYNGAVGDPRGHHDSCTNTAPSTELSCATIDPDGVVTQLAYDAAGDLTSKSTPDGNTGGELATTTYGYDTDGEQTSTVAPDGNLSGANTGNFTTSYGLQRRRREAPR